MLVAVTAASTTTALLASFTVPEMAPPIPAQAWTATSRTHNENRTLRKGHCAILRTTRMDWVLLEDELRRQLNLARRHGVDDFAKSGVANVSIDGGGAEELSMVEDVKRLHPELQ